MLLTLSLACTSHSVLASPGAPRWYTWGSCAPISQAWFSTCCRRGRRNAWKHGATRSNILVFTDLSPDATAILKRSPAFSPEGYSLYLHRMPLSECKTVATWRRKWVFLPFSSPSPHPRVWFSSLSLKKKKTQSFKWDA